MGLPFAVFFGDKTKAELEKELERVNAEIAKLENEKAEIIKAIEAHDSASEG